MENIGESNSSDQFYRYKRPKLVARVRPPARGLCMSLLVECRSSPASPSHYDTRDAYPVCEVLTWKHSVLTSCHSQIEGRGNGIKTNTVNLVDISKALERPPDCE